MSGKTHRLQIGDITCIVLHEGPSTSSPTQQTPEGVLQRYPNAAASEISDDLQTHGYAQPASMNALYIATAGTRILVDTGMGDRAKPALGHIPAALAAEGISVEDIDIVFITHFHGDHIFGLLNEDGTPRYANSRTITTQTEWDAWMSEDSLNAMPEDRAADLQNTMAPLKDSFDYLHAGDTLAPGVFLVDMAGHTLGHTGLLIESNGERLFAVVDLLHSLPQFKYPHWHFAFDTDGDLAEQNRKAVLARAADENLLTLFYHLPFPGLGHVTRQADGTFAFQAM
ncbi:MAG: MBL fold metallo-hydrolase [Anaerolineae bacterium]|nr:MBL fold metallo-hydrolase [Anaerolineae bacterium]